jgi:hypothetical protein
VGAGLVLPTIMQGLKNYLPYLYAIVIAIALFFGGIYLGVSTIGAIHSESLLGQSFPKNTIENVIETISTLTYLDENDIEKARDSLQLREDGNILSLENYSPYADKETLQTICKVLKSVAKRRSEHPQKYQNNNNTPDLITINTEVSRILSNPKACQHNNL